MVKVKVMAKAMVKVKVKVMVKVMAKAMVKGWEITRRIKMPTAIYSGWGIDSGWTILPLTAKTLSLPMLRLTVWTILPGILLMKIAEKQSGWVITPGYPIPRWTRKL
jgi:hypothetical protein